MNQYVRGLIQTRIAESVRVKTALLNNPEPLAQIEALANGCLNALQRGGKIVLAGNGGSFADAQHLSAEFTARLCYDRAPLPALALGTNSSSMTAIGNDYHYDQIFAREVRALAQPADLFIPITTSGNSPNILAAVEVAREMGVTCFGLTGQGGGDLAKMCNCVRVPSAVTARIQECHILIGHIVCEWVEQSLFPPPSSPAP
ncbi:MAG: SIS domain-containing protein [Magnetococcales bacterium]|nr:SIS domain-containing protein [Magnetococcales bacterium]NGZ05412.1 SIS domain-containing protein [Magnetococcales bacterium]